MGQRWRWAVVVVVTAALAALPSLVHLLPGGDSTIDASTLLSRVRSSAAVTYTGYAQSQSGLRLPVGSDAFSAVDDLFGGTSRMRVWWRGAADWRVDSLALTGETDVRRTADGIQTWDYETNTARLSTGDNLPIVRLPRIDDLVPPNLARRLLGEAAAVDVSRIPGRRVAGEETAGLRLRIHDPRSTISHVDVWALPATGLPVRVDVVGAKGASVISTSFLDLTLERPSAATTRFRPGPDVRLASGAYSDIVAVIDRLGQSEPPQRVAGLDRQPNLDLGTVGVYGSGITLLVAIPLSERLAGDVVPELLRTPGVVENSSGISVGSGPLNLQLTPPADFGARWLLVGTLTKATLTSAVPDLPPARGFGFRPDFPALRHGDR